MRKVVAVSLSLGQMWMVATAFALSGSAVGGGPGPATAFALTDCLSDQEQLACRRLLACLQPAEVDALRDDAPPVVVTIPDH